jgi:hypothetical protein
MSEAQVPDPVPPPDGCTDGFASVRRALRIDQQAAIATMVSILDEWIGVRPPDVAELTLAKRKLQEARHWLGEALGQIRLHRPDLQHPYPEGDNPESVAIEPEADVVERAKAIFAVEELGRAR